MSYANANLAVQKFVSNYGNLGRNFAAIDYFLRTSAANTSIELKNEDFTYQPGKKAKVKINYWPIQCDVDGDCNAGLCDDGDAIAPVQQEFTIGQCTATRKWRVNEGDIRLLQTGEWDFSTTAQQMIKSAMPAARKMLAIDLVTYAYTLAGLHPNGATSSRIQSTNIANGIINPVGKMAIEKEFMDAGLMGPNILGDDEMYYFKRMVEIGGLNNSGQNVGSLTTNNIWYDDGLQGQILNDVQGGGHTLAIDPEVFKLIFFHENAGIFRTDLQKIEDMDKLYSSGNGEGFILGSLVDTVTGIIWDLYVNFVKCHPDTKRPAWTFQLKLQWDMFVMPDTACNAVGVNGIMAYRTCPPVIAPCPTGDAVPSPVAARTRAWNPSFSYPLNIYQSTIGGITVTHSTPVTVTNDADLVAYLNDNYGTSIFSLSGSQIIYTGYLNLSVSLNNGAVTGTFA